MNRFLAFAAAATALSPLLALAADKVPNGAGEIRLVEVTGVESSERKVVDGIVPEAKGKRIETAQWDLDFDGRPEIVARIKSKETCDATEKSCRTVVLKGGPSGWSKIFDRQSQVIDAGKPGFGGIRGLVVDKRETFQWTSNGYRRDILAGGTEVTFQDAPANFRLALVAQFGPGAQKLAEKSDIRSPISVKISRASLKDDNSTVLVARLEGSGACGSVEGCPWRVLQVKDNAYVILSEGQGNLKMAVLPVVRGGWRDIIVETPRGYAVYGWTGKRYVIAENGVEVRKQ